MDLLGGYGSDDDSEVANIKSNVVAAELSDEDDDDDDDDDDSDSNDNDSESSPSSSNRKRKVPLSLSPSTAEKKKEGGVVLPSALDALSSIPGTPAYLTIRVHDDEFQVRPVEAPVEAPSPPRKWNMKDKSIKNEQQHKALVTPVVVNPAAAAAAAAAEWGRTAKSSDVQQQLKRQKTDAGGVGRGGGDGGASAGDSAGKDKQQKLNAKERVKEQRLKGQSGIGEDFRQWKSEEEMLMRQQFD